MAALDPAPVAALEPAPEKEARYGPGVPTLVVGNCEPMAGPSMDWRDRYPLGASIDQPNCRQQVQVYMPFAQAAQVEDPTDESMFRVPAIHRRTGAYTILAAPTAIGNVGLIFRDCSEYDPVPTDAPTNAGWIGTGSYAEVILPVTWHHPL